ncbi:MAG: hypothetical protein IKQ91_06540 [Oscillospiraceae bacterium]|nr:hypothetical protein [Oscillospiraceae bacterium]
MLLHENGEIRLIRKLSPSHYSFISECEFDAEGKLVRFALNPHYDPDFSSPEHEAAHRHIKTFDASSREQGGVLKKAVIYSPNRKHSRTVEFDRSGNVISEHADSI